MFQKVVLPCEAVVALARTVLHVAVDQRGIVDRCEMPVDIGLARESSLAFWPFAWNSLRLSTINCQRVLTSQAGAGGLIYFSVLELLSSRRRPPPNLGESREYKSSCSSK